ncbi:MAG: CBS domain-containing protein [Anaerolineaceae bacterium]
MLVGKRMSSPVITVHPDATLEEALNLMKSEHIRRLPVVDSNGNLIGIVSERQLLAASPSEATTLSVYEIKGLMNKVTIDKIMTTKVFTVTADMPVEDAARMMADQKIGGMPVVEGTKIVGMITETDVFKVFLEMLGAREKGLRLMVETRDAPGTFAKISQAIFEAGGNIIALGTFMGKSSDVSEIMIKADNIDKEKLLKVVSPFILSVVDVREVKGM